MPDPPLLLLADDLTGALDCAAAFAARGRTTFVSTSGHIGTVNAQIIALNAGSRPQPPAQATRAIQARLRAARDSGASLRFVKIDSTLRGHPGLEIGVAADAAGAPLVIVTPAFPDNGRTVAHAELLIDGVPLVRTEVGADPLSPVASSAVAVVLRQHTDAPVVTMPLATIRSQALVTTLADLLPSNAGGRPTIVSCDAVTNADLDRLIAAGQAIDPPSAAAPQGSPPHSPARPAPDIQGRRIARRPHPSALARSSSSARVSAPSPIDKSRPSSSTTSSNCTAWRFTPTAARPRRARPNAASPQRRSQPVAASHCAAQSRATPPLSLPPRCAFSPMPSHANSPRTSRP